MLRQELPGPLAQLDMNVSFKAALYQFAMAFIHAHLTDEHLATFRLLVTERVKAPEITNSFFAVGPDETDVKLSEFFAERLGINIMKNLIL